MTISNMDPQWLRVMADMETGHEPDFNCPYVGPGEVCRQFLEGLRAAGVPEYGDKMLGSASVAAIKALSERLNAALQNMDSPDKALVADVLQDLGLAYARAVIEGAKARKAQMMSEGRRIL